MLLYKNKYATFLAGLIIITLIASLHFFAVFTTANHNINDILSRYSFTSVSEKVVIIEVDRSFIEQGDQIWLTVLKNLWDQKAKQIVFNFLPVNASDDFYRLAAQSKKVVFGQRLPPRVSSYSLMNTLPKAAIKNKVAWGLMAEINQQGVYRHQPMGILIDDELEFPSLELIAAKQLLPRDAFSVKSDFEINFMGGVERLPVIKLRHVLSKGIAQEFVSGRTVFIAAPDLENGHHFFTPIANDNGQLSATLLHGFALDTLLSQRVLHPLPEKIVYVLIVFITLSSLFFYAVFSFKLSELIVSTLSLLFILLCWILLQQFFIELPVIEFLLAPWLIVWIINRYYLAQNQRFLEALLFELSLKLQKKIFPVNFYCAEDAWTQSIAMINQTLNLNRLIFLERLETGYWLKEVKCFNCAIEDINEKRRDYRRVPYITAFEEGKPILLDELPYLKDSESGVQELNYLAPLIFDKRLLGFWVFTIDVEKVNSTDEFIALAQIYMTKIAETLYYYQTWQKRIKVENNKLMNYFSLQMNQEAYQLLNQSVRLLEKRVLRLQESFNQFNQAIIVFDLFGQVILMNQAMETLAKSAQLTEEEMSLLAFIMKITGFDAVKVRQILQQIIGNQLVFSVTVPNFSAHTDYLLTARLLNAETKKEELSLNSEMQVIDYQEIICELIAVNA